MSTNEQFNSHGRQHLLLVEGRGNEMHVADGSESRDEPGRIVLPFLKPEKILQ